jgi:hypothetical protein
MDDDKRQPEAKDPPDQAKPEQLDQQAQQSRPNSSAQSGQRAAPGRKPLFRN